VVLIRAAADSGAKRPDQAVAPWPTESKNNIMKFSPKENQTRKVLAIAALGVAGSLGLAACSTAAVPELLHSGTSAAPVRPAAAADSSDMAREIARIAIGNGGLAALDQGDGQAYLATCDPGTVTNRSAGGTSTSALCGISYADGSVWQQTVTVTFDSQGKPVADGTSLGTEMLMPTGG
jgi:hypothetical protein